MARSEEKLLEELQQAGQDVTDLRDVTDEMLTEAQTKLGFNYGNVLDFRLSYLEALKKQIKEGKLTTTDYSKIASPIVENTASNLHYIAGQGGGNASLASGFLSRLNKFQKTSADGSYEDIKLPFNRTEWAQLPINVLPTEADINTGVIARDAMPFQRVQNPTGGVDAQGNPIPTDINLGSDRGAIELEAQRQAGQLTGTLEQQKALREKNRTELAGILADRQTEEFKRAVPQLAEQANMQGTLRSTGFGEQLAKKYTDLTADTQFQLAQQGLSDTEKYVGGLGDIANVRAGLQTSGLQREFSLDDAARSEQLAKMLTEMSNPSSSSGKTTEEKWGQGIQLTGSLLNTYIGTKGAKSPTGPK